MAKKEDKQVEKKKEERKERPKKTKKVERKVVNKEQPKLYSLEELADIFCYKPYELRSLFLIRGLDINKKLTLEEAKKKLRM